MARPSLLAWLWQNEAFSDMTLRLCTTQRAPVHDAGESSITQHSAVDADTAPAANSDSSEQCLKVARLNEDINAAGVGAAALDVACEAPARSYRCHGNILASCSSYFKTRLSQSSCSSGGGVGAMVYATTGGGTGAAAAGAEAAPGLLQIVEHVEECELDAMEAMLRHCYTGQLCRDGDDAAQLSVATLLQMLVLADRFDVPPCLSDTCNELVKRAVDKYDIGAINQVMGTSAPGVLSHSTRSRIVSTASERLLQLLGNAEAVCCEWYQTDRPLNAQLMQLRQPTVLALLSSDALQARGENSILMLADAWMSGPAGAACSAAEQRQIVDVLRLGQLSYSFSLDVVPLLAWLQTAPAERDSLVRFSHAGAVGGATRQARLVTFKQVAGPAAWYDAKRRATWAGPANLDLQWDLPLERLAEHLQQKVEESMRGPSSFFNGFEVTPSLFVKQPPAAAAWLGLKVQVMRAGLASRNVHCRDIDVSTTISVTGPAGRQVKAWAQSLPGGYCSFVLQPLKPFAASVPVEMVMWAPLLVGEKVLVVCTVTACA